MSSVKIKGLEGVKKSIKDTFDKVRKDAKLLTEISDLMLTNVVGNARSGKNGDGEDFADLKQSWIKKREYLLKNNNPGEFFLNNDKSNLTFTGEFLNSLKRKINPDEGLASVEVTGKHSGYKYGNKKGKPVENTKIAEGQRKMGRDFLIVGKPLRKQIVVAVKRFLRRIILTGNK